MKIPFNKAHIAGKELYYIAEAVLEGDLMGDGPYTQRCHNWLRTQFGVPGALLTHSCTGALEMSALLLDIKAGDEVIMPSFTFVSTANAFVLRGAKLKFVDVRSDTLNINESLIEAQVSDKTRAICVVHYGGVGCEMDTIMELSQRRGIPVVEDAAHAIMAKYRGKYLGTFGCLSTFSFHATKNYSSGEGGALLINDPAYLERAEIIREKGTNRSKFFRGQVDKYTWVDVGSSYLPSEIIAAFLFAQFEHAEYINGLRRGLWSFYHENLAPLEEAGHFQRPHVPAHCESNAHNYFLLLNSPLERDRLMEHLNAKGVNAVFHYLPLHLSPYGEQFGFREGDLPVTENTCASLLRLPLFNDLTRKEQLYVVDEIRRFFG